MDRLEVFIAEDEPPIADMIASMVDEAPAGFCAAFIAHDGKTMLEHLASHRPALLLADIRMPVMDGLGLVESARKLYPDLPCAIITSASDFEYARAALRAGAMDYILKTCLPESLEEVLFRVRRSLGLGEPEGHSPNARLDTGARLKEHLDRFVRGPFDLQEVAKTWGYNALYLSRAFKALVGVSPKRYHTNAKIDFIISMLRQDRRLLLKEAAAMIHFDDELYLAKVFRKETGMSFTEFRQKMDAGVDHVTPTGKGTP
ncbi:MAG: response regulator [Spirochaetota bacterium]